MPSKDKKLCLLRKSDDTDSGLEICGYLWTVEGVVLFADYNEDLEWNINDGFWSNYRRDDICDFDMLIDFSDSPDKNGRLLKEGDIVKVDYGWCIDKEFSGVITLKDGRWMVYGIKDMQGSFYPINRGDTVLYFTYTI